MELYPSYELRSKVSFDTHQDNEIAAPPESDACIISSDEEDSTPPPQPKTVIKTQKKYNRSLSRRTKPKAKR